MAQRTRPEIHHQKRRGADDGIGQRLDELLAGRIDPVQILDQHHRAVSGGPERASVRTRSSNCCLARFGIEFERRDRRIGKAEKIQQHERLRSEADRSANRSRTRWRDTRGVVRRCGCRRNRAAIPAPAGTASRCRARARGPRDTECPCGGNARRIRSTAGSCRCRPRRRSRPPGRRRCTALSQFRFEAANWSSRPMRGLETPSAAEHAA